MQNPFRKKTHCLFIAAVLALLTIGFMFGFHQTAVSAKSGEKGHPESFAELIKKSSPPVVNIIAVKVVRTPGQGSSPFGADTLA